MTEYFQSFITTEKAVSLSSTKMHPIVIKLKYLGGQMARHIDNE
jgi:hypothetical protein